MKFTIQDEPEPYTVMTWRSDCKRFAIVVCPYAFGQHRIQLWHWIFGLDSDPDIPGPHW